MNHQRVAFFNLYGGAGKLAIHCSDNSVFAQPTYRQISHLKDTKRTSKSIDRTKDKTAERERRIDCRDSK